MKYITRQTLYLTAVSTVVAFAFPAMAQKSQSFSSCVVQLDKKIHISDAIDNCKQAFRGRPVNEEYSTCVETLDRAIHVNDAIENCNEVFQNASQPDYKKPDQGTTTIIINPGQNQPQQSQPIKYNKRKVCISPVGTQVHSTRACELGVSGFTWKTIYEER